MGATGDVDAGEGAPEPSAGERSWGRTLLGLGLLGALAGGGALWVASRASSGSRLLDEVGTTGMYVSIYRDRHVRYDESVRVSDGEWVPAPAPGAVWVDERDCWSDGDGRYWTFPDQVEVGASGCPEDIPPAAGEVPGTPATPAPAP